MRRSRRWSNREDQVQRYAYAESKGYGCKGSKAYEALLRRDRLKGMDRLGNNGLLPKVLCVVAFMSDGAFLLTASRHAAKGNIPWLILLYLALSVLSGAGFVAANVKSLGTRKALRWCSAAPGVFMLAYCLSIKGSAEVVLFRTFWSMLFWIPFLVSVRGMAIRTSTVVRIFLPTSIPFAGLMLSACFK